MSEERKARLADSLRGLLHSGVDLLHTRLDLFVVEAQEEKERLVGLLVNGVLCALLAGFGLVFLAVFLTVLLWDGYRLLALGLFTVLFLGGAAWTARNIVGEIKRRERPFNATLTELQRDRAALRRTPEQ